MSLSLSLFHTQFRSPNNGCVPILGEDDDDERRLRAGNSHRKLQANFPAIAFSQTTFSIYSYVTISLSFPHTILCPQTTAACRSSAKTMTMKMAACGELTQDRGFGFFLAAALVSSDCHMRLRNRDGKITKHGCYVRHAGMLVPDEIRKKKKSCPACGHSGTGRDREIKKTKLLHPACRQLAPDEIPKPWLRRPACRHACAGQEQKDRAVKSGILACRCRTKLGRQRCHVRRLLPACLPAYLPACGMQ